MVEKIVALKGSAVETLARDYTQWDEMVVFTEERDLAWAKDNFEPTLATFGVDSVSAFALDGTPLHAVSSTDDGGVAPPPGNDDAAAASRPIPKTPFDPAPMLAALRDAPFHHAFVRSPHGWYELRGAAIHEGTDRLRERRSYGHFIVARL